jgi:hypothetical protein
VAIGFTTLFTALGKIAGALNEWNTGRGSELTSRVSTLRTQVTGISSELDANLTSAKNSAISGAEVWPSYLASLASETIRYAVLADRPQTDTSFSACLTELVRQMGVAAESLATNYATVGAAAAVGVPTGTPKIVVSDLDPYTQAQSNFTLPDVLNIVAQGASTAAVQGKSAASPVTHPDWPSGSGVNTTLTLVDASTSTLGADPSFESWNAGPPIVPANWTIVSGTGGTTVARATDDPLSTGTYCLQFLGDGTTLRVRQAVTVSANTVYFIHAFLKRTANPANTGTMTIALRDSSGTLLSGTTSVSVATSAAATSWTANTAVLATPATIPTTGVYLEIQYNGGVGDTIRVDQCALNALPTLYTGGVRLAIVKGITATVYGDTWTQTTTRANPELSLIRQLNRLLTLTNYTVRIPTSGAPTQADALVS